MMLGTSQPQAYLIVYEARHEKKMILVGGNYESSLTAISHYLREFKFVLKIRSYLRINQFNRLKSIFKQIFL